MKFIYFQATLNILDPQNYTLPQDVCLGQTSYFFTSFEFSIWSCDLWNPNCQNSPSLSVCPVLGKEEGWSLLTQQVTSELASPFSVSQSNTKGLEWEWNCQLIRQLHRAHPCTVPLSSSPLLWRQYLIHPKVFASGKAKLPFMASTHQSLPSQGWEHRLPWGMLSWSSINNTKCSVSSAHTKLPPTPTVLTGGRGNLGNTDFDTRGWNQ